MANVRNKYFTLYTAKVCAFDTNCPRELYDDTRGNTVT